MKARMKPNGLFVGWLLSGIVVLGVTACTFLQQQIKPENKLATIQDITVTDHPDKTEIVVVAEKPLVYTSYELTSPMRLVVDLAGTSVGRFKERIPIHQGAVIDLLPIGGEEPSHVTRLEIALSESVSSRVRVEGSQLVISIDKPAEALSTGPIPEQTPEQGAEQAPPDTTPSSGETAEKIPVPSAPVIQEAPLVAAKTVSQLTIESSEDKVGVVIAADGMLQPDVFMVAGNRLVVDLPDVMSSIRPSTIPVHHRLLKQIRIGQSVKPKKVRVVFDLNTKVSYTVDPSGKNVAVTLIAAGAELPSVTAPPAPPKAEKKEEIASQENYTGRKISLDFQNAEISNVLRLLADVSGFNIVISDDVTGKISLKLINVPWDQALDIVLKMHNLGQVREGNIIRVALVANITKQQDDEARAKEAKIKAEDLVTEVVYVNYAKAEDLAESLKKNLSPRGDITIDKRTNTMIVKDIKRNLNDILALVKTLDTRTPQVQIEARIVQADTTFAQSLGIQWGVGFSGISSNNVFGIQGINTGSGAQPGFGVVAPDFAVNLPAVPGFTAPSVGFNFGRFTNNPINLDLRLSAGELNGLTKTISSPKITTLDNVKAKIEQGESIPFQTTSQQGTQTTFIDANLTLEVTPHITSDQSIIMKVKAARNSVGSASGPAGPSILKKEAMTEVLVKDGETTVIGGIFVDENINTSTGIPLLSRIPILGWLFKSETKRDTRNELLIFITPRIIKE